MEKIGSYNPKLKDGDIFPIIETKFWYGFNDNNYSKAKDNLRKLQMII